MFFCHERKPVQKGLNGYANEGQAIVPLAATLGGPPLLYGDWRQKLAHHLG
jgi:hypothetical protein